MKSDICKLGKDLICLENVLHEVEKTALWVELEKKNALRLRLLAEELCGMLPGLIKNFDGEFWVEKNGDEFKLNATLHAGDMDIQTKEALLAVSKSGENEAAKGIMGKIRDVVQDMLLNSVDTSGVNLGYGANLGYMYSSPEMAATGLGTMYSWSLNTYKTTATEQKIEDAIDELERSIVANLADDILVGVRGNNVEIVVKKTF